MFVLALIKYVYVRFKLIFVGYQRLMQFSLGCYGVHGMSPSLSSARLEEIN